MTTGQPVKTPVPAIPQSVVSGMVWPAMPNPLDCFMLGMLHQLEAYERLPAERLLAHQLSQLGPLVDHAVRTVPWYRRHYGGLVKGWRKAPSLDTFRRFPVLTRQALQRAGSDLRSQAIPTAHGRAGIGASSGSTGRQVEVLQTEVSRSLAKVQYLRQYRWHGLDLSAKAGAIRWVNPRRAPASDGDPVQRWAAGYPSGPALQLSIEASISEQIQWLLAQRPAYLLSYPTNLAALARRCLDTGTQLPWLKGLRAFGEVLDPGVRTLCRQAFGVGVIDEYSAAEVGPLAMQCPEREHFHLCSDFVLLEILGADGRHCGPGEVGRVVVTALHNFAMPLIRYELGDYGELGEPCPCGRGLPVLRRVLGRTRNMLLLPGGEQRWPLVPSIRTSEVVPVRQFQVVQQSRDRIQALLVVDAPVTAQQEAEIIRLLQRDLGHPFRVELRFVDEIPRASGGKYEDFRCEVTP